MDRFLEYLRKSRVSYLVHCNTITVMGCLEMYSRDEAILIPNNVTVTGILRLNHILIDHLPENLSADILEIEHTSVAYLPESLRVRQGLSINARRIKNIAYRERCGAEDRTIFACYINNNKFIICAGCFMGTLAEFDNAVYEKYYGADATQYRNQARECIIELAEKLGKPIPQDVFS